jgi:hypothetical protein
MVAARDQARGHLPLNIFQHHNRVVHHNADGEHKQPNSDMLFRYTPRAP